MGQLTERRESPSLAVRKKRLCVLARQRGTLEICILLERFVALSALNREHEIVQLEELMDESDQDISCWLAAAVPWPVQHEAVLEAISQALKLPFARPLN